MLILALESTDGDHHGREALPENWGMEREGKERVPRLRRVQAAV